MTITEFLEARIAEDEAVALAAAYKPDPDCEVGSDNPWGVGGEFAGRGGDVFRHILRHDPARVLAECAVKRAILADRMNIDRSTGMDDWYAGCSDANWVAVKALAAVYADHPGYQQEWAV